jgi:hypothetical protein
MSGLSRIEASSTHSDANENASACHISFSHTRRSTRTGLACHWNATERLVDGHHNKHVPNKNCSNKRFMQRMSWPFHLLKCLKWGSAVKPRRSDVNILYEVVWKCYCLREVNWYISHQQNSKKFILFKRTVNIYIYIYMCVCVCLCGGCTPWSSGWGIALQTGRSRDRFPVVWLGFFIDIILPAALWPCGRLSH